MSGRISRRSLCKVWRGSWSEPDAVGSDLDGNLLRGTAAVREFLADAVSVKGSTYKVIASDDVALMSNAWHAVIRTPDGQESKTSGHTAEVARRQPDGTRLFLLDSPRFMTD